MTHAVSILRRAQKELQQLPREDYERVRDAIRALAHEPRPAGCLVLTGRAGWRIRAGTYRVIYETVARHQELPPAYARTALRLISELRRRTTSQEAQEDNTL
jgi:mRNA interferase RelE/StbE